MAVARASCRPESARAWVQGGLMWGLQEERRQAEVVAEVSEILGVDEGTSRSLLESHDWSMELAIRAHNATYTRDEQREAL